MDIRKDICDLIPDSYKDKILISSGLHWLSTVDREANVFATDNLLKNMNDEEYDIAGVKLPIYFLKKINRMSKEEFIKYFK